MSVFDAFSEVEIYPPGEVECRRFWNDHGGLKAGI